MLTYPISIIESRWFLQLLLFKRLCLVSTNENIMLLPWPSVSSLSQEKGKKWLQEITNLSRQQLSFPTMDEILTTKHSMKATKIWALLTSVSVWPKQWLTTINLSVVATDALQMCKCILLDVGCLFCSWSCRAIGSCSLEFELIETGPLVIEIHNCHGLKLL